MKKIFTYFIATACMASVTSVSEATSFNRALSSNSVEVSVDKSKISNVKKELTLSRKDTKTGIDGLKKVDSSRIDATILSARKVRGNAPVDGSSIDGDWIFTLGDYYLGTLAYYDAVEYLFTASYVKGDEFVVFNDPEQYIEPFVGELDVTTGKLTFLRGYLGGANDQDYGMVYFYQQPYVYDWIEDDISPQTIEAQYDEEAGTITFAADNGMSWEVYTTQAGTEASFIGYYDIFDLEDARRDAPYEDNPEDWTDLGNALLMDGWVLPAFGIDQTNPDNWYEVPMQRNKDNKNLYRLVNPYKVGPAAQLNESDEDGWIEIDVTNPNAVIINENACPAGFANSDLGIKELYCFNSLVCWARMFGTTPDVVLSSIGDTLPLTVYKDGVITLGTYDDPDEGLMYDANFGYQGDKAGGYIWTDANDNAQDMSARITMPGYFESNAVDSVIMDKAPAAVYYDMNGVRVENPVKGGIYILKKGAEASKVVIR